MCMTHTHTYDCVCWQLNSTHHNNTHGFSVTLSAISDFCQLKLCVGCDCLTYTHTHSIATQYTVHREHMHPFDFELFIHICISRDSRRVCWVNALTLNFILTLYFVRILFLIVPFGFYVRRQCLCVCVSAYACTLYNSSHSFCAYKKKRFSPFAVIFESSSLLLLTNSWHMFSFEWHTIYSEHFQIICLSHLRERTHILDQNHKFNDAYTFSSYRFWPSPMYDVWQTSWTRFCDHQRMVLFNI